MFSERSNKRNTGWDVLGNLRIFLQLFPLGLCFQEVQVWVDIQSTSCNFHGTYGMFHGVCWMFHGTYGMFHGTYGMFHGTSWVLGLTWWLSSCTFGGFWCGGGLDGDENPPASRHWAVLWEFEGNWSFGKLVLTLGVRNCH